MTEDGRSTAITGGVGPMRKASTAAGVVIGVILGSLATLAGFWLATSRISAEGSTAAILFETRHKIYEQFLQETNAARTALFGLAMSLAPQSTGASPSKELLTLGEVIDKLDSLNARIQLVGTRAVRDRAEAIVGSLRPVLLKPEQVFALERENELRKSGIPKFSAVAHKDLLGASEQGP